VAPAVPALDVFDGVDVLDDAGAGADAAGALAAVDAALVLTAATARWISPCMVANIGLGVVGVVFVAACGDVAGAGVVGWPFDAEVAAPFAPLVTVVVVVVVVDAVRPLFCQPGLRHPLALCWLERVVVVVVVTDVDVEADGVVAA